MAQQMLFQETAQEFLKVGEAEATSEWSKVGRIGSVGGKRYALADAYLSSPKRRAVEAYQGLNYHVTAMGDSFNDMGMLDAADAASFIHPPEGLPERFPHLPVCHDYAQALEWIETAAS